MAAPKPDTVAAEILDALAPMLYADAAAPQNDALSIFINALTKPTLQEVEDYASDDPITGAIGYSALVDILRTPDKAIPWLAQFVGVELPGGLTPAQQRQQVEGLANLNRGTLAAMTAAVAPYLTTHNYITNGDFEIDVSSWTPWTPNGGPYNGITTTSIVRSTAQAKKGTASMLLTALLNYEAWAYTQVPVSGGDVYTYTAWMRQGIGNNGPIISVDWFNGTTYIPTNDYFWYEQPFTNPDWTLFTLVVTAPPSATKGNFWVGKLSQTIGDNYYVDDIRLIKNRPVPIIFRERFGSAYKLGVISYKSQTPVEDWSTTNKVLNGGFESNTTGWSGTAIARSTAKSKFGTASLRLITAGGSNDSAQTGTANGDFAVGDTVTFSCYVNPDTAITLNLQMNENNIGGTLNAFSEGPAVLCPANVWTRLTHTKTLVAGTASLGLYITTFNVQPITTLYIDGVQVEKNAQATPYVETNGAFASRAAGNGPVGAGLLSQKPGGIVMIYNVLDGQDYQLLLTNHATYALIRSSYLTYSGIIQDAPGV